MPAPKPGGAELPSFASPRRPNSWDVFFAAGNPNVADCSYRANLLAGHAGNAARLVHRDGIEGAHETGVLRADRNAGRASDAGVPVDVKNDRRSLWHSTFPSKKKGCHVGANRDSPLHLPEFRLRAEITRQGLVEHPVALRQRLAENFPLQAIEFPHGFA